MSGEGELKQTLNLTGYYLCPLTLSTNTLRTTLACVRYLCMYRELECIHTHTRVLLEAQMYTNDTAEYVYLTSASIHIIGP